MGQSSGARSGTWQERYTRFLEQFMQRYHARLKQQRERVGESQRWYEERCILDASIKALEHSLVSQRVFAATSGPLAVDPENDVSAWMTLYESWSVAARNDKLPIAKRLTAKGFAAVYRHLASRVRQHFRDAKYIREAIRERRAA